MYLGPKVNKHFGKITDFEHFDLKNIMYKYNLSLKKMHFEKNY